MAMVPIMKRHHSDEATSAIVTVRYEAQSTTLLPRPGGNAARTGHRNPNARLTPEAVAWVREVHGQGRTISEMARELGVHHSTVSDVVRGVSWRPTRTEKT